MGVGLEKAAADSNAKPGDRIRYGGTASNRITKRIKMIDAANGHGRVERRQVPRTRWRVTEENSPADRKTAAHDPDLVAAPSPMVIIEKALNARFPRTARATQYHGSDEGADCAPPRARTFVRPIWTTRSIMSSIRRQRQCTSKPDCGTHENSGSGTLTSRMSPHHCLGSSFKSCSRNHFRYNSLTVPVYAGTDSLLESRTRRRSRSGCVQCYQVHPDGWTSALDRTSSEATLALALLQKKSGGCGFIWKETIAV